MKFEYLQPDSLENASAFSEEGWQKSSLLAGGTDLRGILKHGIENPDNLVNLKNIDGLDKIEYKRTC
jgi:CO/xanthine dehydrogenase FAD-binding subunit